MRSGTTSTSGSVTMILTVAVVIVLVLSAFMVVEVSSLQGQVSSLQNQNTGLQQEITDLQSQQNFLQSALLRLLSTSTTTPRTLSFTLGDVCISIAPNCSYLGFAGPGPDVYAIVIVNNGTVSISATNSVAIEIKDATKPSDFVFNTTLPSLVFPGGSVSLNSTSWPAFTNATSKISPGDNINVIVSVGDLVASAETLVVMCGSSINTFVNYTSTMTLTATSCVT